MNATEFLMTQVPFLSGLTPEQAQRLAAMAERHDCQKGHTLLFRGTTVEGLYVLCSGRVAVLVKKDKGRELSQVAELGAGDVFGETSIIENTTAGATIRVVEDGTAVLVIPQEAFREVLGQNPGFAARASALIASRKAPPPASPQPQTPA